MHGTKEKKQLEQAELLNRCPIFSQYENTSGDAYKKQYVIICKLVSTKYAIDSPRAYLAALADNPLSYDSSSNTEMLDQDHKDAENVNARSNQKLYHESVIMPTPNGGGDSEVYYLGQNIQRFDIHTCI